MHDAALRPRKALARSSPTTPRLHLPSRISTQYSFTSRKHRKPNETKTGVHFYPVQMSRFVTHPLTFQEFLIATFAIRNHTYLPQNNQDDQVLIAIFQATSDPFFRALFSLFCSGRFAQIRNSSYNRGSKI